MTDPSPAEVLAAVSVLRAHLDYLERNARAMDPTLPASPPRSVAAASALPEPAGDTDLDGQYGDPAVFKDPPRWSGPSFAGAKFSDCPPDYLRTLADFLMWRARKCDEEGKTTKSGQPQSAFLARDAARALGWARRGESKSTPRRPAAPSGVTGRGSMADEEEPPPF